MKTYIILGSILLSLLNMPPLWSMDLIQAAEKGKIGIVRKLLKNGADVNQRGLFGCTALHQATCNGYSRIIQLLIKKGATVNRLDGWGETPLHEAASQPRSKIVQLLIEKGADVNCPSSGWSPLHKAVYGGRLTVAKVLVAHGADLSTRDGHGNTPLATARHEWGKNSRIYKFLKKAEKKEEWRKNHPSRIKGIPT